MRRSNTVMAFEQVGLLARNNGKDDVSKGQKLFTEAETTTLQEQRRLETLNIHNQTEDEQVFVSQP